MKPGDRVMLVFGCCEAVRRHIGEVFTVNATDWWGAGGRCNQCGNVTRAGTYLHVPDPRWDENTAWGPAVWFIKVDGVTTFREARDEAERRLEEFFR